MLKMETNKVFALNLPSLSGVGRSIIGGGGRANSSIRVYIILP